MNALYTPPIYTEKGNIVVADDNDKVCLSLKKYFEEIGYGVYVCQSLSDVMEINHVDVKCVVLAINIDNDQAFQVIEMIRQSPVEGDVPIVVTSDVPSAELVLRAIEAGADDYLLKPFTNRDLYGRMQSAMRSRGFA